MVGRAASGTSDCRVRVRPPARSPRKIRAVTIGGAGLAENHVVLRNRAQRDGLLRQFHGFGALASHPQVQLRQCLVPFGLLRLRLDKLGKNLFRSCELPQRRVEHTQIQGVRRIIRFDLAELFQQREARFGSPLLVEKVYQRRPAFGMRGVDFGRSPKERLGPGRVVPRK